MDGATMGLVLERIAVRLDGSLQSIVTAMRGQGAFRILVATLLSLRTRDAVTAVAAAALFELADTPQAMLLLPPETIARTIHAVGFYNNKSRTILAVSRLLVEKYGGRVPSDLEALLALPGVGRKTANLVLIHGFGKAGICVDTHVHRICNRLGFVATPDPDRTEFALRETLPPEWWMRINDLLVSYGQTLCTPLSPWCSRCVVADLCAREGVARQR